VKARSNSRVRELVTAQLEILNVKLTGTKASSPTLPITSGFDLSIGATYTAEKTKPIVININNRYISRKKCELSRIPARQACCACALACSAIAVEQPCTGRTQEFQHYATESGVSKSCKEV
jgi:hypothetical protein